MTKAEIRAEVKRRIAALTAEQKQEAACAVAQKLAAFLWHDKKIMLYSALADEVDMTETARLLGRDNELFYPVVDGDEMFAALAGDMKKGAFGILQPGGKAADATALDAVVVPLRAFDAGCMRLGRGRGYYDRFLRGLSALTIGAAFDVQMADGIPAEAHDVPLDAVVTPTEIYRR